MTYQPLTVTTPLPASGEERELDEQLVADLVTTDPRRAAVFERLGIDYCCGGKVALSQACADHGLDLKAVRELLVDAVAGGSDERDWSTATVDELITDIVERHHGFLRTELPRTLLLAHKVARAHGDRDPRLVQAEAVVTRLVDELRTHTAHEEGEVFPALQAAAAQRPEDASDATELAAEVGALVDDHTQAAEHLEQLRTLLEDFDPPAHACTSWRAYLDALQRLENDLHRHVHKENHILFPMVMDRLYAATQGA